MKTTRLIQVMAGVLLILVLAQGVQAAKPTPTPTPPPAVTYSFVKTWTFPGQPWDIAVDSSHGWIYVADHNAGSIKKFDTGKNLLKSWSSVNWGLAVDKSGYIYTDGEDSSGINNIYKFDSSGSLVWTRETTYLSGNRGLTLDSNGNIYVAEWKTNQVRKYTSDGILVPGWTLNAQFNGPEGVAVDNLDGWIYVTDQENNRIQKFDITNGRFLAKWVTTGSNRDGQFNGAEGIAVDLLGNIYITDVSNYKAQKYDSSGNFLTSWGQFSSPSGIAVDEAGNVYVADYSAGRIDAFAPTGVVVAAFTADTIKGPVPLTVTFTDHSTGASTYSWDFGDGETSVLPSLSHTYTNAGTPYIAKLTINGPGGPSKTIGITVEKADATVSVNGYSGVYDGNAHGASGTATGVPGVPGPVGSLNLGSTFSEAPGGKAYWTFTGGTNYQDESGDVAIDISKADATVSVNGYSGVYDGNAHGASGTATGVKGESLSGLDLGSSFTNVPGGTANWVFTDVTGNYNDKSGSAAITISKATASVTPDPKSKTYGEDDPVLTGTLTGFLAGDGVTAIYSRTSGENVGSSPYTITATLAPEGALDKYDISYNTANFAITPRPITVTADARIKVQGDKDPALTYTITEGLLVNGDTFSGALSRDPGDAIGTYAITQGDLLLSSDYTLTYVGADLTIEAPLAANFDAVTPTTGSDPLKVLFTDTSTGDIVSWHWDFGNEETYDGQNPPEQIYTADPNTGERFYTVTLVVTNHAGTDAVTKTQYITVTPLTNNRVAQAVKDVENQILGGSTANLGVFAIDSPLASDSEINFFGDDARTVPTCGDGSDPVLVFIDKGITKITLDDGTEVWKAANYENTYCSIYYACANSEIIDLNEETPCMSPPTQVGPTPVDLSYADGEVVEPGGLGLVIDPKAWNPVCQENCDKYYALLIDGGVNKDNNEVRYWYDIAFMYNTLREYGYPASHIKVLMSDGTDTSSTTGLDRHISNTEPKYDSSPLDLDGVTTTNEVNDKATHAILDSTLDSYATGTSALPSDATLFIFTTGHGGSDTATGATQDSNTVKYYLWNNEYITDKDFVAKLNAINCKAIIMVMAQCNGGGFYDEFIKNTINVGTGNGASQDRTLITATLWNEPSWANGFSNAWTTGVAGHDRWATESVPNYDYSSDTYPDPYSYPSDLRISMQESKDYVVTTKSGKPLPNDPFALTTGTTVVTGKEHPQIWSKYNSGITQLTQFLNDCISTVPKTITVKRPTVTGIQWQAGSQRYIYWAETGMPTTENAIITLLKNGVYNSDISASVPVTQKYFRWIIPDTQATGNDYRVNIASLTTSTVNDKSDFNFVISTKVANGNLNLKSVPSGASITMDYVYQGTKTTNTTFTNLRPGEYLITLEKVGFIQKTEMATVPSTTGTKVMTLIDASGSNQLSPLDIISDPLGAEVFIDGEDTGVQTPASIDVTPGVEHKVYVIRCNQKSEESLVTAPPYDPDNLLQSVTVSFVLNPNCYTFTGFEPPITMTGVNEFNTRKVSSLPMKWHLSDALGNDVTNPASFVNIMSFQVDCSGYAGDPTLAVPEKSSGDIGLQYIGAGNWQFNVQINKAYAGTCRKLYALFDPYQISPEVIFKFR